MCLGFEPGPQDGADETTGLWRPPNNGRFCSQSNRGVLNDIRRIILKAQTYKSEVINRDVISKVIILYNIVYLITTRLKD